MAAAAAEQTPNQSWLLAQEAFPQAELRARRRVGDMLGKIAVRGEAEIYDDQVYDNSTLKSAIDERDKRMIRRNVSRDIGERVFKVGLHEPIELKIVDERFQQDGRFLSDIHRNTLQHTVLVSDMLRRTKQEFHNVTFFEELLAEGILETHDAIIFSPSSTSMTREEKESYNFFVETESCSIQRLAVSDQVAELETAFVAGKAMPDSERHDIAAIINLGAQKGIPIMTIDGTEMLSYVMLVPKTDLPDGVINMVQAYDEAAGGTFYGEAKPKQDYVEHARACHERNRQFDEVVESITERLLAEAADFRTPLDAMVRLDQLSEAYCVQLATTNLQINAAVFGPAAAMHIEEARFFMQQGEHARAEQSVLLAQSTATSGSCPLFKGSRNINDPNKSKAATNESSGKKFMTCPYCKTKVFGDPCAKVLSCWDCKAKVVDGHVVSRGNGGGRTRAKQKAKERRLAAAYN